VKQGPEGKGNWIEEIHGLGQKGVVKRQRVTMRGAVELASADRATRNRTQYTIRGKRVRTLERSEGKKKARGGTFGSIFILIGGG